MPIKTEEGCTVITGASVEHYRLLALRQTLWLEIKAPKGMRVLRGRSAYSIIKETYALTGSKQSVFEQFTQIMRDWGFPV
jgi:hypothetical protein